MARIFLIYITRVTLGTQGMKESSGLIGYHKSWIVNNFLVDDYIVIVFAMAPVLPVLIMAEKLILCCTSCTSCTSPIFPPFDRFLPQPPRPRPQLALTQPFIHTVYLRFTSSQYLPPSFLQSSPLLITSHNKIHNISLIYMHKFFSSQSQSQSPAQSPSNSLYKKPSSSSSSKLPIHTFLSLSLYDPLIPNNIYTLITLYDVDLNKKYG